MAEKTEKKNYSISADGLMSQENFMKSLSNALEGMKAFENEKGNNMYQDVDNNEIRRPVEIELNKDGKFNLVQKEDKKKNQPAITACEPIAMENVINCMHTMLTLRQRKDSVFISEATMKKGYLKAKDSVEPTYIAGINHKTGEYYEKKMYHVSQVEVDKARLDKANAGYSKAIAHPVDVSNIVVKVSDPALKASNTLRKQIASYVEREGKGKLANLDDKAFMKKMLGYAIVQGREETFNKDVAKILNDVKEAKGIEKGSDLDKKLQAEYVAHRAEIRDMPDPENPKFTKHRPKDAIRKDVEALADKVLGKNLEKEAPKKEKKAKKTKDAPAR